ncbi:hypothetical protein [Pseudoduganella namucuonensis]|uniref:DUF2029 domain-containing protein n=1 Tax=Pseudoduganella namucuonensis TaxID=1035707 RepID=A0A1I7GDW2_9BURK|nr:hypothetical protein [Pseudoduganella namucuonensis]SFU46613.1 hypothetical protein SAMN05216552_1003257 [Pseudoduganella namucuonensis]
MLDRVVYSRHASLLILLALYWMVAAAAMSGFAGKWAFRDGETQFGIELVLDDAARKPFAYRRLAPELADMAQEFTPPAARNYLSAKLGPGLTFARAAASVKPAYQFRYVVIYYLCFVALLGSLFVLRGVLLELGVRRQHAVFAPLAFVLAFPYLETVGGYFYDCLELFFLATAMLLALRRHWLLLVALALPATLNKESFFFFLPTLYPLIRDRGGRGTALLATGAAMLLAGLVNAAIKWSYLDAEGGAAHFQLLNNVYNYARPRAYLQAELTYGVVGPSGAFAGVLMLIAVIALRGWLSCPAGMRRHLLLAACVNVPLFLAFCAPGELRNLSILFPGFVVLVAHAMEKSQVARREGTKPDRSGLEPVARPQAHLRPGRY